MSTILLTTDLSPESKRAFAPAKLLAQKLGLKLRLIAVLEDLPFEPTGGGLMAVYPDRSLIHRDWDKELQKLAVELGRDLCPTAEVIEYLLSKGIVGWGSQCIGTDAGQAGGMEPPFPAHNLLHKANRYGLASLANLDKLPAKGAILIAAPLKIENGTGSPIRALALVPRA